MALWTDPSRQFLISSIRDRPVLWDKNITCDQNYRNIKNAAFIEVTNELNRMFPMCTKFSCEDVRSQWKNLKDTFVRKLRWLTEGKYNEDPTKEPTWKFYRMLTFLDDKEAKRMANVLDQVESSSYHDPMNLHSMHTMKSEDMTQQHNYDYSNHSTSSSEEQMLQMFVQNPSPPSPPLPMAVSSIPCSTETICAKPPYTPQSQNSQDSDDEPKRKRPYNRRPTSSDEFDIFGAYIAAQLKRVTEDHSRSAALRLQKKLSDVIYEDQIHLMENR
ncbi:unnamed protein product [Caenorhabditis angaria]|uniref:MADF domain-containing protein n=1 Tax=Caenorhabditis angaria TaxID=860376 RepID=A0A9P1MSW9_9PELO|nr:unnamed protein product [Caenorhabditis angaria]